MRELDDAPLGTWIRAYLERLVNSRDLGAVDELVSSDYLGSGHGWAPDREKLRDFYTWQATTRPDWYIDVRETVELGDWVAVRADAGGTVSHDASGRPLRTSARRSVEWLSAFRVSQGLLAETRLLIVRDREAGSNPGSRSPDNGG